VKIGCTKLPEPPRAGSKLPNDSVVGFDQVDLFTAIGLRRATDGLDAKCYPEGLKLKDPAFAEMLLLNQPGFKKLPPQERQPIIDALVKLLAGKFGDKRVGDLVKGQGGGPSSGAFCSTTGIRAGTWGQLPNGLTLEIGDAKLTYGEIQGLLGGPKAPPTPSPLADEPPPPPAPAASTGPSELTKVPKEPKIPGPTGPTGPKPEKTKDACAGKEGLMLSSCCDIPGNQNLPSCTGAPKKGSGKGKPSADKGKPAADTGTPVAAETPAAKPPDPPKPKPKDACAGKEGLMLSSCCEITGNENLPSCK
jgi:hypothetical protein